MNDRHRDGERLRDDLAAYALDALDRDEAAQLERHLEDCESCRDRLQWLRPAVDQLPGRRRAAHAARASAREPDGDGARRGRARRAAPAARRRVVVGRAAGSDAASGVGMAVLIVLVVGVATGYLVRGEGGRQRVHPGPGRRGGDGVGDARAPRRLGHAARQRAARARTATRSTRSGSSEADVMEPRQHLRPARRRQRRGRRAGAAGRRGGGARHRRAGAGHQPADRARPCSKRPCSSRARAYSQRRVATCYRHPGPRDQRLLLELRPADLPGLHDLDSGRHALSGVRAPADAGAQPDRHGRTLRRPGDLRPDRRSASPPSSPSWPAAARARSTAAAS